MKGTEAFSKIISESKPGLEVLLPACLCAAREQNFCVALEWLAMAKLQCNPSTLEYGNYLIVHANVERQRGSQHHKEALRLAENAVTNMKVAVGKGHDYARALLVLGMIYLDMGLYKTAIKNFEEAMPLMNEESEERLDLMMEMSNAWEELGEWEKVLEYRPAMVIK